MTRCEGLTGKKTQCIRTGKYPFGDKIYCHQHRLDKPEISDTKSKATKTKEYSEEPQLDDDFDINDTDMTAMETCDISENKNRCLRPDKTSTLFFENKNFMNVEHAYHFMKFWYPADGQKGKKLLEISQKIYTARSMEAVRDITVKNSQYIIPKWNIKRNGQASYSSLVLFSIFEQASKSNSSFREKVMSVTTDFVDGDGVVKGMSDYTDTLKAYSNYLRKN